MAVIRKLIMAGAGLAVLGALLVAEPASATPRTQARVVSMTETSVGTLADKTCTHPTFGGTYYCKFGEEFLLFNDGTLEIFVIGTDYAVWTRWRNPSGGLSGWVSLSGQIDHSGNANDLTVCWAPLRTLPTVNIRGTDSSWWDRTRQATGVWTAWARRGPVCSV
jgi:hypothetical protein